ncbi:MAG: polyprenol monophosphomannose synthase [Polyangiales bacterium]
MPETLPAIGERSLIVTPTYNERENLEAFLEGVFRWAPAAHVLIVDDNSPDGTGALADQIAARDPRVSVMHRPGKMGLGSAYREAFAKGLADDRYDYFYEMDTDLSHDPQYLPQFERALHSGADAVIGSRNVPGGGVEGWGVGRHLLSKGGSLYSRTILGLSVRDLTSGYKGFRRRALEAVDLPHVRSEGYSFQIEMTFRLLRKGFRVAEVPIVFVDRRQGASKMSRRIFAEAIGVVWKLRADAARGKL